MVLTPWGESDSLRDRRLRPGPGTPRKQVDRNQRERLFGAMVACVAEKGYEETRVSDLLELSGVSSRTFYDFFADKRACFVATLETMIGGAIQVAATAGGVKEEVDSEEDWEALARQGDKAFAGLIVAQPAAARMILIEAPAAGEEVVERLEGAIGGFEALTRQTLSRSPERRDIPPQMVTAYIGAMREIARTRLLQQREAEMPAAVDELWDLVGSFRAPPVPLRPPGRVPPPRVESLDAHDHAERAIRAFAVVVAEKGFGGVTIDDILRRASMSATTFYAHFEGKRDLMTAAIDSSAAQMLAAIQPAVRRAPDWPRSIRAGFAALFSFLASRPALARLIAVEVYAAGADAVRRRAENMQPLEELLERGHEHSPEAPAITVEAIAGVVYTLAHRQIRSEGPESLPNLVAPCTYMALAPFIGPEAAAAAANETGMSRTRSQLRQAGESAPQGGVAS